MECVGLANDDIDSTRTFLPPQTKLQERTVSQQRTTGHLLRFLCLLNLCSLTTYLFTSFSAHRPAQRECARTGLRSHVRCHPCPIPQPVKVGHTTGVYDPYSFRIVMWVLLRSTRTNQWECCETGPHKDGFSSSSERTRKSNHLQMSLQRQHFLLSYLKTQSVGPAGVWTRDLPLGRPALSQLS